MVHFLQYLNGKNNLLISGDEQQSRIFIIYIHRQNTLYHILFSVNLGQACY